MLINDSISESVTCISCFRGLYSAEKDEQTENYHGKFCFHSANMGIMRYEIKWKWIGTRIKDGGTREEAEASS